MTYAVNSRSRLGLTLYAIAGLSLALPGAAQAATKSVEMGAPVRFQTTFEERYQSEVNDFFPHGVTIRVGDSVRFVPRGFHTVDIPRRGQRGVPLLSPTGSKVAGLSDAAGSPFWFNGLDELGFTKSLLRSNFGRTVTYDGSARVQSGVPLVRKPRPMTVRFARTGFYKYLCDVHPGMGGSSASSPGGAES